MRWNRSRRVYKQISLPPIVPSLERFWPTLKLSAQDRPVPIPVPLCSPGRFPSFPCQHWLCALPPARSPAVQGIPVARCLAASSPCPLAARLQAGAHPAPLEQVPATLTSSCGSSQCTCREETNQNHLRDPSVHVSIRKTPKLEIYFSHLPASWAGDSWDPKSLLPRVRSFMLLLPTLFLAEGCRRRRSSI